MLPREAQSADVPAVDVGERAVAPAVERAPPHQPVAVIGRLEHGVGDGRESVPVRRSGGRLAPGRLSGHLGKDGRAESSRQQSRPRARVEVHRPLILPAARVNAGCARLQ